MHNNRETTTTRERIEGHQLAARHLETSTHANPMRFHVTQQKKTFAPNKKRKKEKWCDRGVPIVFTSNDTCSNCILLGAHFYVSALKLFRRLSRLVVSAAQLACRPSGSNIFNSDATRQREQTNKQPGRPCHVLITCCF